MPDRNEETGQFESAVDETDIEDLFDSREPRSTREVANTLDISRSRAYELLQEAEANGVIASKKFEELAAVIWYRE
ncbi:transcriptional regulator [Natrialba phage PhiCh1]|uniref:Immunity protein phiCh1-VP55 n=2 Tax=root TaxID=1 RepID=D3T2J9_NATMM|nr:hypothetical protein [Natrialba magadii]NP_665973.1 transcriptional regulator [Natrialba phage PhiCh1]YP_010078081.1 transcriptional regulator [Natrialba phage PhiCh1]AAM88729.1 putative immunity protein [Natrialba phage PhiCh1]ADD07808.1 putative immunity protein phiCh1-VP55 [Natrialba magadii ATCC 43099]ELY22961.1 hypothetical protein C500_20895 [Natrialba magadii ATCC 43099]QBJ01232.1 putative immunity protein [Natrialba phage PhiCh1]